MVNGGLDVDGQKLLCPLESQELSLAEPVF